MNSQKVHYSTHNVMSDPDMREILKEMTKSVSYPMLFIDGIYLGSLNFLRQCMKKGGLVAYIPASELKLSPDEKIR
jgi:glutaredoxin-related protein